MLLAPRVLRCCTSPYHTWRASITESRVSRCTTKMEPNIELNNARGAVDRVLLYHYDQLVQGTLQRRYKRFLADVAFTDNKSLSDTAVINTKAAQSVAAISSTAPNADAVSNDPVHEQLQQQPAKRRRRIVATGDGSSTVVSAAVADLTGQQTTAVVQDTAVTVVHCPNTGSMMGLLDSLPTAAACSVSAVATRKYKHTLEMISIPCHTAVGGSSRCSSSTNSTNAVASSSAASGAQLSSSSFAAASGKTWVGVHSALANKLIKEVLSKQLLPNLGQYITVQPEVKVGNSRFDFVLTRPDQQKVYVEVKSITLAMPCSQWAALQSSSVDAAAAAAVGAKQTKGRKKPGITSTAQVAAAAAAAATSNITPCSAALKVEEVPEDGMIALFPDAVSERAQKHVQELTELRAAGHEAVCIFAIQRSDCCCFAPAVHIDPGYAAVVKAAAAAGVQMIAVVCEPDPGTGSIWFKGCVPVFV